MSFMSVQISCRDFSNYRLQIWNPCHDFWDGNAFGIKKYPYVLVNGIRCNILFTFDLAQQEATWRQGTFKIKCCETDDILFRRKMRENADQNNIEYGTLFTQ